jgi:pilus assembly protein Flp/PilA
MDTARQLNRTIRGFIRDERGASAIEYALIAAGIAVTIVTAVTSLGDRVREMYETIGTAMGG